MNGIIGTVEVSRQEILTGEHNITEIAPLADGIESPKAGSVLVYDADGYKLGTADDTAYDAVLLDDVSGTTAGSSALVCVHGSVRAEKLLLGSETATEAVRPKLRLRSIYAAGSF